jgi:hypothetical protein
MKKVTVHYSATFESTIEVPDDATLDDIEDKMNDIDIPENDGSKYVSDSFEPITDDDGNPQIFDVNVRFFAD